MSERRVRSLAITEALVRAYSRRGNYHSEPAASSALGLPGLVAQGMQAAGPAYGVLLDAWGEEFLAHGELDMQFVGMVLAGDTVDAIVDVDAHTASFEVRGGAPARVVVVGTATVEHGRDDGTPME